LIHLLHPALFRRHAGRIPFDARLTEPIARAETCLQGYTTWTGEQKLLLSHADFNPTEPRRSTVQTMSAAASTWFSHRLDGVRVGYLGAVAFGHCSIDILNAAVAIFLTALVARFDLNNTELAWGITFYFVMASLPMPLFGILADRWDGRWLAQIGVLWTAVAFLFVPFIPTYPLLLAVLAVAALGSAAFHATGTRTASLSGGVRHASFSTSIFFFLGQIGLSTGPIIAGVLIREFGLMGIAYMALGVLPMVAIMQYLLHRPMPPVQAVATLDTKATRNRAARVARSALVIAPAVFILYVVTRSATLQNFMSLLPKYFADQGLDSAGYGARAGALVLGGSLGTLAGGLLDGRVRRKHLMMWSLWLSIPFLYLTLNQDGIYYYLSAALAGFVSNTSHSVIVVQAQAMLPKREGLASGLALGVMFASGAVMTGVAGLFADIFTLRAVMYTLAFLPILAGALLLIPTRAPAPTPTLTPSPGPAN